MLNPGQSIRLRSSARTNVGQVRENNEDNIHLWAKDDFVLAVVADGMGGAAAGEEASRIAVETIQERLSPREPRLSELPPGLNNETVSPWLLQAIRDANINIVEKAASAPEFRGMGTTVTMAFVRGDQALVAHVGDSRAYIIDGSDGSISQITSDHSFVEALRSAGHITQEQAEEHPMRNVLYRALGQSEEVDIDLYHKQLHVGDRLVLCSDGLTRHVKAIEIARVALESENPDTVSQILIDLANARGGEDNVSVIVILVEDNAPVTPGEKHAVIISEEDGDETLILRERSAPRRQIPNDELDVTETAYDQEKNQLRRSQLEVNEWSEDEDNDRFADQELDPCDDPIPADDPLDQAIAARRDLYTKSSLFPTKAALPSSLEGDGEGRDTRIPEQ